MPKNSSELYYRREELHEALKNTIRDVTGKYPELNIQVELAHIAKKVIKSERHKS